MRQINEAQVGLTAAALSAAADLSSSALGYVRAFQEGGIEFEVYHGSDSLWVVVIFENGAKFALRTACGFGAPINVKTRNLTFEVDASIGRYVVELSVPDPSAGLVRCVQRLTPRVDLIVPPWPRDLYPVDCHNDCRATLGTVKAAQRGLNGGLIYMIYEEPVRAGAFYFQDLTSMNEFFRDTEVSPDSAVGGLWPELGYAIQPSDKALPAGKEYVISDAYLCVGSPVKDNPQAQAEQFLEMLSCIYSHLQKPETEFRDWPARARATLRDLEDAPEARVDHYGKRFVRPYVDAEYPDSMVHMTVLSPLKEYEEWAGKELSLVQELRKGVINFYDKKLGSLRRYLPNVGKDKNKDEVDSWYLYHPLSNLAWIAKRGDEKAKKLFFETVEFGIKVARHFKYDWPVQYNIKTLEVIKERRSPNGPGQSDTGGLYAYLMVQAYELSGDKRYIEEATKAIKALDKLEFELDYQANLMAWGATACVRLWTITGDRFFIDQSKVFLAGFFHNCVIWDSDMNFAKDYSVFLGATCLHDASYMAIYECFDSFIAFHQILNEVGDELSEGIRLLIAEYNKYVLHRAIFYYPEMLPKEAVASKEIRNGKIVRHYSFPLEDLYVDGRAAGSVGQEIYGCGAAFALTVRAFHRPEGVPFMIFAEYPLRDIEVNGSKASFKLVGPGSHGCKIRFLPKERTKMPKPKLTLAGNMAVDLRQTGEGHLEAIVPGNSCVSVEW